MHKIVLIFQFVKLTFLKNNCIQFKAYTCVYAYRQSYYNSFLENKCFRFKTILVKMCNLVPLFRGSVAVFFWVGHVHQLI